MVLQKGSREETLENVVKKIMKKRSSIGTKLITLLGVLVLHDCMMVVFQNNLSMKPLVIAHSVVSEHIDVPHQHSKGNYAKFCRVLFQKRL